MKSRLIYDTTCMGSAKIPVLVSKAEGIQFAVYGETDPENLSVKRGNLQRKAYCLYYFLQKDGLLQFFDPLHLAILHGQPPLR